MPLSCKAGWLVEVPNPTLFGTVGLVSSDDRYRGHNFIRWGARPGSLTPSQPTYRHGGKTRRRGRHHWLTETALLPAHPRELQEMTDAEQKAAGVAVGRCHGPDRRGLDKLIGDGATQDECGDSGS